MKNFLKAVGYDDNLEIKHRFTYIINSFSIGLVGLFLIFYIVYVKEALVTAVTCLCLADLLSVYVFLKQKKYSLAKILLIFGFLFQEFSLVFLWFPKEANFNYFLFIVAPISFFIYDFDILQERIFLIITNTIAIVLLVLSELVTIIPPVVTLSYGLSRIFTILSLISTIGSTAVVFYFYTSNLSSITKELRFLADTDVLTKIYNRRTLDKEGNNLFSLAEKYNRNFAFIILDIDYFKSINDRFGHPAGDSILVQMTELISDHIRQHDILARYGGEEFALLLKDSSSEGNLTAAENLRALVENHEFNISDTQKTKLTISLGIVNYSEAYKNFEQMIQHADKALYKAKADGRNRVVSG